MSDRVTITSATVGPVFGTTIEDNLAAHIAKLYDVSTMPLTAVGGTANAVTASLDPPLLGATQVGMKYTIMWAATNTGAVTLSINGGSPEGVLAASGAALTAGALRIYSRALIEWTGANYRVLSQTAGAGAAAEPQYWAFTTTGTWTKPTGLDDNVMIKVAAWGAGGGGHTAAGGGGGGGAYMFAEIRAIDLPSSVTCTVPAGGAAGANGAATTFGSVLTAFGGAKGEAAVGGAGAGSHGVGDVGGGAGATATTLAMAPGTLWGGAGGGSQTAAYLDGAKAVHGGAGGGGTGGVGGNSISGGNGGDDLVAGADRGGGGGRNAAGGRGEIRIWI